MKNLTNSLVAMMIAMAAFFGFSSFGSVPSAEDNRVTESREQSAEAKRESKKQARMDARRAHLEERMATAKNDKQKDRIQRKIDRTERPKKAEILGLLALIFGAVGLGLVVTMLILMWFLWFWPLWYPAFLLCAAGLALGIVGLIMNDDKKKARIGLILGAIGIGLLLIAIILFFAIAIALI